MSTTEYGYVKGDACLRNGCNGIIDEHDKDGSCSCHIHPPCGYCATNAEYCPECGWEAQDEPNPVIDPEIAKRNQEYYARQMEEWDNARDLFYRKYRGEIPAEKLELRTEAHTHFTQYVRGIFPINTETTSSILSKVQGTFGGRFTKFNAYSFEYIAYTD